MTGQGSERPDKGKGMKVQWKPEHETQIQRNFHMKASHWLSEMFRDAQNAGE
ncbi:hypothetical protein LR48_Vigan07g109000 [Vigna angularis]|uniref:Uncharacterized protein n=1 Tax=Phaseolus angularis TaxID=3914 RepID=A0A0L9UXC8_PHAAN|nr:hypothetical protein LR48_Vigan07g109000 [Vigna angularis]